MQIHYNSHPLPPFPHHASSIQTASPKLSADSQRLAALAQATIQAASRLEERNWERSLDAAVHKLLKANHQDAIDHTLDHLFATDLDAYDALMESAEAVSESCSIEHDGAAYDALLIAAPVLAWTRFSIASGAIPTDMLHTLSAHLSAHLLAPGTRLAMAPHLFSIDQLPHNHAEAFVLTQRMAQTALKDGVVRASAHPAQTVPFLADTRYLLAVIAAPAGTPLFRWQGVTNPLDANTERDHALQQWRDQATPNLAKLLPGCGVELLLPEAYYVACREADKQIRPASIRAAVHFLTHTLSVAPVDLRAIIGGFGDPATQEGIEEYRIGFTLRQSDTVAYGIVWPLYGQEDAEEELRAMATVGAATPGAATTAIPATPIEEILGLLHEAGVVHIKNHQERFPMEFCDDCGAPLFADADGELVHPEMPEDAPPGTQHFH
ncbi:DUF2863 family protein [Undibacterium arcticum]|uniref:DUF2863 family protein n=1 Tax=Undibacterium arcticum TaxID=1762892 RepID=UPI00360CE49D